jgi:heme exporter protein CcmD
MAFIAPAYAISALAIAWMAIGAIASGRRLKRDIAALEAAGFQRRGGGADAGR